MLEFFKENNLFPIFVTIVGWVVVHYLSANRANKAQEAATNVSYCSHLLNEMKSIKYQEVDIYKKTYLYIKRDAGIAFNDSGMQDLAVDMKTLRGAFASLIRANSCYLGGISTDLDTIKSRIKQMHTIITGEDMRGIDITNRMPILQKLYDLHESLSSLFTNVETKISIGDIKIDKSIK